MISTYSRVRASGFGYGWPYQPSTTCGPDAPSPKMNRPAERWSLVSAAIAVAAGVRADSWMMDVPSWMRDVAHPARHVHHPAVGPHAGRDGDGRAHEGPPLGWAVHLRAGSVRTAGG